MKNILFSLLLISSFPALSQYTLGLAEAQKKAIEANAKLKNSRLETQAALQTKAMAKTNYYPKVSFDAMAMHAINPLMEINSPGGNLPVYDGNPANLATATEFAYIPASSTGLLQKIGFANVGLTQPIYAGGKIKIGNEMAQLGVDINKQKEVLTEKEILLQTAQQYWQIVSLQEKEKTIVQYEALLDRLYIQVSDAFKAGLIIRNDVYKLELEQNELALNKSKLLNGKKLAFMQFCNTTGMQYDSTLFLADNIDNYQAPSYYQGIEYQGFVNDLSEVQLLEKVVKVQELQTAMKKADTQPIVALGVNALYMSQFDQNTNALNALGFLSVSIPISERWLGKHEVNSLRIKEEIAQNTLSDTKSLLELRAAKSRTDLLETHHQIEIIKERIIAADENLKVNQSSYDNGVQTLADLLEAKAMQVQAKDDLIEAKTKYQVAITAYLQHVGK